MDSSSAWERDIGVCWYLFSNLCSRKCIQAGTVVLTDRVCQPVMTWAWVHEMCVCVCVCVVIGRGREISVFVGTCSVTSAPVSAFKLALLC